VSVSVCVCVCTITKNFKIKAWQLHVGQNWLNGYHENVDDKESQGLLARDILSKLLTVSIHTLPTRFSTKRELCTYRHSIYQSCHKSLWTPYSL